MCGRGRRGVLGGSRKVAYVHGATRLPWGAADMPEGGSAELGARRNSPVSELSRQSSEFESGAGGVHGC